MNRRVFLGAAAAGPLYAGPNDRLRGAVLGVGNRGTFHVEAFKEHGAEVMAVCDVYEPHLERALAKASPGAKGYEDYREILDDPSIDFVVVSTPDHWHARMAVDAMNAGKDVYLEKPIAHTIEEGFEVVDTARRTKRVVQVGTQRRSNPVFIEALGLMGAGGTGSVRLVDSWWHSRVEELKDRPLPGKLNWEMFLGSAPKRPFDKTRYLNWYWYWDYAGGMMVAQCAHLVDAVAWFLGADYPLAVTTAGNGLSVPKADVPPNTCMCIEYPGDILATITVGYNTMRYRPPLDQMIQYHGREARLDIGREAYALYPEDPKETVELKPSKTRSDPGAFARGVTLHIRNFLECVRTRQDPRATVEMGQYTNVTLCMASESLKTGRRIRFNAAARRMEA